jgi:hypothetical protein
MYKKQINFCPDYCQMTNYSKITKMITCECIINYVINDNIQVINNIEVNFDDNKYKYEGFDLLKCNIFMTKFPDFKSYLNYIILIGIFIFILGFIIFNCSSIKNIKNLVYSLNKLTVKNPPKKKIEFKKNNKNNNFEKIIIKNDFSEKPEKLKYDTMNKSTSRVNLNKEAKKLKFNSKEKNELNKFLIYQKLNFLPIDLLKKKDLRTSYEYFIGIFKEKVYLISIFTNENFWFTKIMNLVLNYFILTIASVINALNWKNEDLFKNYSCYFISAIIGLLIYSILHYILSCYNYDTNFNNIEKINNILFTTRIKNLIILILFLGLSIAMWFYIYLFGIIHENSQSDIIILTFISILIIIIFQFIIGILSMIFRNLAKSSQNQILYSISQLLYFLL